MNTSAGGSFLIPRRVPRSLARSAHTPIAGGEINVAFSELMSTQAMRFWNGLRLAGLAAAGRLTRTLARTLNTLTSPRPHPSVLGRKCVAVLAMGFVSVSGGNSLAAQDVDARSNGFKVAGIATSSVPAKVVYVEPIGNRTNKTLIDNAMSGKTARLADKGTAVTLSVSVTQPRPALVWPVSIKRERLRVDRLVPHAVICPLCTPLARGKE